MKCCYKTSIFSQIASLGAALIITITFFCNPFALSKAEFIELNREKRQSKKKFN